ncbi:hypothetical protein K432DRAFT_440699 [Lepidopterella palustris CBS 459.81]|uniref:Uncharacterized protein n=1 Tax=Lepidopterella palustris CBS 459.81 TaxID=1314670 RepID=A0A8E2EGN0_9PEZI|nr:hypothetical protein K432DRAFT_440699 [Lepidopterella palustris CBS 459.81]
MAYKAFVFPAFEHAGVMDELSAAGIFSTGICIRATNNRLMVTGKSCAEGKKSVLAALQRRGFEGLVMGARRDCVVTNPYAGLGLVTGILDASSLVDVLESVIQKRSAGKATPGVSAGKEIH